LQKKLGCSGAMHKHHHKDWLTEVVSTVLDTKITVNLVYFSPPTLKNQSLVHKIRSLTSFITQFPTHII